MFISLSDEMFEILRRKHSHATTQRIILKHLNRKQSNPHVEY